MGTIARVQQVGETSGRSRSTPRGWLGAGATGLVVGVVLGLVLLLVPHLLLTQLLTLTRAVRVGLATVWIVGATVCLIALAAHVGRAPGRPQ